MRKVNRARYETTIVKSAEGCQIETTGDEIVLSTPKAAATVTSIGNANLEWLDRATRSAGQYEVLA